MTEALSSPKRRLLQEPHGITSQETPFVSPISGVSVSGLYSVSPEEVKNKILPLIPNVYEVGSDKNQSENSQESRPQLEKRRILNKTASLQEAPQLGA
jgi:hypothetical protein